MTHKDGRVVLSAWVEPVLRNHAREAAKAAGVQFSQWVEGAVRRAVADESWAGVLLRQRSEARAALHRIAVLMQCEPDDDDDLVEAVRMLVSERDDAMRALARALDAERTLAACAAALGGVLDYDHLVDEVRRLASEREEVKP